MKIEVQLGVSSSSDTEVFELEEVNKSWRESMEREEVLKKEVEELKEEKRQCLESISVLGHEVIDFKVKFEDSQAEVTRLKEFLKEMIKDSCPTESSLNFTVITGRVYYNNIKKLLNK